MSGIILNGITWGHSRGITPLLAISQRYAEWHPEVEIRWKKRSLQEFADYPLEKLVNDYDLLVIDHPWVGRAASGEYVIPLNEYLPPEYLNDQLENSVGDSHLSYHYKGRQWALAIDAATPAASYRADLLECNGMPVPQEWSEVLHLAKMGKLAVPAIPIDLLMNFYSWCLAHGKEPFAGEEEVIDTETGILAIETMKELYSQIDDRFFRYNPIQVAELMTGTDEFWYCPFAYAYSNYARSGYSRRLLNYTEPVSFGGKKIRTTIGGTGLAVSGQCRHKEAAVGFAALVASGECQRTLYAQNGGQPAHRSAWLDSTANQLTNEFFRKLLPVMESGYLRPRYNGYLFFQDHAGLPLQHCFMGRTNVRSALEEINRLYRESLIHQQPIKAA